MVRGKKIGLGEFLGEQAASYIPGAALPSGPRARYVLGFPLLPYKRQVKETGGLQGETNPS